MTPAAIFTAFVMVAVPVILLAFVWGVLTMLRIAFPERPVPLEGPLRAIRRRGGHAGVREIRAEVLKQAERLAVPYAYTPGTTVPPSRLPSPWLLDVHERRN